MKRVYKCIPVSATELPKTLTIYTTQIGENKRDQAKLAKIKKLCNLAGFFFEKNTTDVYQFITKMEKHHKITHKYLPFNELARLLRYAMPCHVKNLSSTSDNL